MVDLIYVFNIRRTLYSADVSGSVHKLNFLQLSHFERAPWHPLSHAPDVFFGVWIHESKNCFIAIVDVYCMGKEFDIVY